MHYFRLDGIVVLEAAGPDARRYLNSRLTNDLYLLTESRAVWAAMHTPQGRPQGLFTVFQEEAESYRLVADGGSEEELLRDLLQFKVADRVEARSCRPDYAGLHFCGAGAAEILQSEALQLPGAGTLSRAAAGELSLIRRARIDAEGLDIFGPADAIGQLAARAEKLSAPLSASQQRLCRFKAGLPLFPVEINQSAVFAESGLFSAVSCTKGCYVGQEVMAKIDSIGRLPARLLAAEIDGITELAPGAEIRSADADGGGIGKVVSACCDEGAGCTYAFVRAKQGYDSGAEILISGRCGRLKQLHAEHV